MIKKFFKDITGITATEERIAQEKLVRLAEEEAAQLRKEQAAERKRVKKEQADARRIKKEEEEAKKLTPKDLATKKGEPWVDVIGFQVNKENVRNGFFELDWNDQWVEKLKFEGYGFDGDPEEEIIARWYRDICFHAAAEEGIDMSDREVGYINVRKLTEGKAEVK